MMIQYATKDFSPLNFELYDLNYELRELHESLSLIRGIRVIRSFFHTEKRRNGETEVGSKATEVPMAQGEMEICHTDC